MFCCSWNYKYQSKSQNNVILWYMDSFFHIKNVHDVYDFFFQNKRGFNLISFWHFNDLVYNFACIVNFMVSSYLCVKMEIEKAFCEFNQLDVLLFLLIFPFYHGISHENFFGENINSIFVRKCKICENLQVRVTK